MLPRHNRICSLIIAVISVAFLTAASAYSEKSSDTMVASGHRIAVVIEVTPPPPGSDESGLSFALAIALDSYVDYHLSRIGVDFQLFQTDRSGPRPSFLKSVQDSGFTTIVTLQASGKFTTVRVPMLSERRRQYFLTVPEQLNLRLSYHVQKLHDGRWHTKNSGTVKEGPRRPWLVQPSGPGNRAIDSLIAVTPEPVEFIIMRSVQKLFSKLKLSQKYASPENDRGHADNTDSDSERAIRTTGIEKNFSLATLPTTIVYDALSSSEDKDWRESAGQLVAYVNRLLRRQFNVEMSPLSFQTGWLGRGGVEPLAKVFQRFESTYESNPDSLVIGLYGERQGIDFFRMREFDAVGFGDAGSGRTIVKLFPSTRIEIESWRPFLTGRSLIHEIGHVFGGIHTSDLNSIMNHSATWLSPDRFDPLNRELIAARLSGDLKLSDPISYARFLSSAITKLQYGLADYPPVFYRLLDESKIKQKRMRQAVGGKSFLLSAEGYGALRAGELSEAANKFREAVKLAPDQASLYYYLALCTQGAESRNAMRSAAALGYNLARERLRIQNTQKPESR